ncbi:MAG: DUF4253 domain-containing protein [Betaproteobacteria bacterium]
MSIFFIGSFCACKAEKPVEQKKPVQSFVVVKPKHSVLTDGQRVELGFPAEIIAKMEIAAGSEAEPFFATVLMRTQNLKGDQEFESKKLAGFSVRTNNGDELIDSYRVSLRAQGYLVFKSHKGYGHLQDIVTVIKGNSSYDILKTQGTEAQNYQLDTKAIIAWLKTQQQQGTFVVTGAGTDWLEARFIKPPKNILAFAKQVCSFAPDVLERSTETADKLADRMKKMNGFYLVWD